MGLFPVLLLVGTVLLVVQVVYVSRAEWLTGAMGVTGFMRDCNIPAIGLATVLLLTAMSFVLLCFGHRGLSRGLLAGASMAAWVSGGFVLWALYCGYFSQASVIH